MATSVDRAVYEDLIGAPYRIKGRGPHEFDCYGLLAELYRRVHGTSIPFVESPQGFALMEGAALEARKGWREVVCAPGVCALIRVGRYLSHVAMVLPDNRLIHSWAGSRGVVIERLAEWEHRIAGYYHYD